MPCAELPPLEFTGRDAAAVELRQSCERMAAHESTISASERRLDAAKAKLASALRTAASGQSGLLPREAQKELAAAEDDLALERYLHDSMRAHVEGCRVAARNAELEVYRPRLQWVAQESIAAARDFEQARAVVAKAVERKLAANAVARSVARAGLHPPFDGSLLEPLNTYTAKPIPEFQQILRTSSEEQELWKAVL